MKITAVVRTHNRKDFLKECLSSISIQTHPDWEVLIFDDGGDEINYRIFRDFRKAHPDKRIVYLTSVTNFDFFKKSWTYPISISEGDIILRIDDDDIFHEGAFSSISDVYLSNPSLDFSFGSSASFSDGEKKITGLLYNTIPTEHKTTSAWGPYVNPVDKPWMWFSDYYPEEVSLTSIIHASRKAIMTVYHPYAMRKSSLLKCSLIKDPTSNFFDDLEFMSTLEYMGLNYAALRNILIFCRNHSEERIMNNCGVSNGTNLFDESNRVRELVDLIRPDNFSPSITEISAEKISIEEAQDTFDSIMTSIQFKIQEIFETQNLN